MTSMQTGMHYPIDLESLPVGWEKGYVGDFALEIQPGFASGKHNKEGRGIPHIRPYNIDRSGKLDLSEIKSVDPEADTKRLHSGDVLFNNTNSPELIGKTTVITATDDWGFSNHMTRVAFPDAVSPKFAAYQLHYLWSRGYFLHNCVKHVNQASVSSTTLARTVPFVRPTRPQQDSIVAEIEKQFSRLDEAVANLKRVKANLKRYKAAVLKAAVEGKLTEDWRKQHPDVEPASKLLERILAERRSKWSGRGKYKEPEAADAADLPPLPSNWKWASLDQVLLNITDGDHQPPPQTDSGVPFLVIGNARSGRLDFEDTRFVSQQYADEVDVFRKPTRGDILYTLVGSFGIALRVDTDREFCIQRHIGILRPHKLSPASYLVHVLNSSFVFNQASNVATGTAQKTVPLSGLRRFAIPLAPLGEQQQILADVERRLSVIEELEAAVHANLTRADRLRQAILQRAFRGELHIEKMSRI